jgi:hypothetical protein
VARSSALSGRSSLHSVGSSSLASQASHCGGGTHSPGCAPGAIYPEADHDSWTAAYAEPELERWLFAQRRPQATATR